MTASDSIPVFDLRMEDEDVREALDALRSGAWDAGSRVEAFERDFGRLLGDGEVVATSSCTAALHLALCAAGIGPGDEVIVPAFTFVATVSTILQAGAMPRFADIAGPHDLGIDADEVANLIGSRTRAVTIVHYGGYPAAPEVFRELCDERGLLLFEDSAHAPLTKVGNRSLGTFGLAGSFSFFPNKILGVGEAGCLSVRDPEFARTARRLRADGLGPDGLATEIGFPYRLDEMRAALLGTRIRRIEAEITRRRELTRHYRTLLAEIEAVSTPYSESQLDSAAAYTMSVLLDDGGIDGARRDAVRQALRERGVQTTMMYPGIHTFSAYRDRFPGVHLPRTEDVARRQITLPLFGGMTEGAVERVVEALAEAVAVVP